MFFVLLRCSCNCCFHEHILLWGDLNWVILFVNVVYVDQVFSALLKSVLFGGVLTDVNYEYLLMKLREIIDRNGLKWVGIFGILKIFLKIFFFSKKCIIFGFGGGLLVFTVDLVSLIYFWV